MVRINLSKKKFLTLLSTLYSLFLTTPVYAKVEIGKEFGFGGIPSLGEGTNRLVVPIFSLATFLVLIYFMIGAFRYLKAGENKEEIQGARQMITHAIIGFGILMLTFFVIQFLLYRLFGIVDFRII